MDRRQSIQSLLMGSAMVGALALESCMGGDKEALAQKVWDHQYGRTPKEMEHDSRLLAEVFFNEHEQKTIHRLAHLIMPANEHGDIDQAGTLEFIEFMVKEYPGFQSPLRGGLMGLDHRCRKEYGNPFISLTEDQQHEVLTSIAYPDPEAQVQRQEVSFFATLRNLVVTSYYTSAVGIAELGYQGNQPNVWDGVPQEVLEEHGLSYPEEWMPHFLDVTKRNTQAEWDDEGNLIT